MAILKSRYQPGEELTAENVNAWEAAIAPKYPELDELSNYNYHEFAGRYDIQVRKNFAASTDNYPPFSTVWIDRVTEPGDSAKYFIKDKLYAVTAPLNLLPAILNGHGMPAGTATGWASFAFTPVYAAVKPYTYTPQGIANFACINYGRASDTDLRLQQGKEGFFCVGDISGDRKINGVNVIKVVRKAIYPTNYFGNQDVYTAGGSAPTGGYGVFSFGTVVEQFLPVGVVYNDYVRHNMVAAGRHQSPYLQRTYQVILEVHTLLSVQANEITVELVPYVKKRSDNSVVKQLAPVYTIKSYTPTFGLGIAQPGLGTMYTHVLTFSVYLKNDDEYVTLGAIANTGGQFSYSYKTTLA